MTTIWGIAGRAGSGKDEIARYLVQKHGFIRRAFADGLKDAARAIFGLDGEQVYGDKKEVVDDYWRRTPREILQLLGTECLRRGYGDDVWVRALKRYIDLETRRWEPTFGDQQAWVIPDVRFVNEAEAIRAWGGRLIRVTRDVGDVGIAGHASEHDLDDYHAWDAEVPNRGTLDDLYQQVEMIWRIL